MVIVMFAMPPLIFAAFVGWLLLFPLGGIPVAGVEVAYPLVAFLLPHAVALILIGRFCPVARFARFSFWATLITLVLTVIYPLVPAIAPLLLPIVGVSSALLSIRTCALLRQGGRPIAHAGLGLVLGNLVLLAGLLIPVAATIKFICLAGLLLLPLLSLKTHSFAVARNRGLFRYLPFVFVFHLVSGIMYGGIMPAFSEVGIGQGGELLFYIAAVIGGALLFRKNRELLLASGILLALLSFSCFLGQSPWTITLSMYAMQAAAGCIDIFLLGYLLSFDNLLEAFGLGNGTVCLSIFCGHQLAVWIGAPTTVLVMAGSLILTWAIFAFYFTGQKRAAGEGDVTAEQPLAFPVELVFPKGAALAKTMLSKREWEVLCCVVSGKTYKVAAAELVLSESTVKTYMKRIYDKYGVSGKRELLRKVCKE